MKSIAFSPLENGFYNTLIRDYINQTESTQELYAHYFDKDGFETTILNRRFSDSNRAILVQQLKSSYLAKASELQLQNIQLLEQANTFTVTTGHQLCIGTGPLYSVYKILTCIVYCQKLKSWFPNYNFVPVFWMAGEDHDVDEIKSLSFFGKEFSWQTDQQGPVGRMNTIGIPEMLEEIKALFVNDQKILNIIDNVKKDYQVSTVVEGTFTLLNAIFKNQGLLVLDADNRTFKTLFAQNMIDDIVHQNNYHPLTEQTIILEKSYKAQLHIRDINFFYLQPYKRDRVIKEENIYFTSDKSKTWTQEELIEEINMQPENFSPNAALRPLYQEVILPNIAYVGGPGEISYWLQLKKMFARNNIDFPILLPRYSAILVSKSLNERIDKLGLNTSDFLLDEKSILEKYIQQQSDKVEIDFSDEVAQLLSLKNKIASKVKSVDVTLLQQVDGLFNKSSEQIQTIENKLKNISQKKYETSINQIKKIRDEFWPTGIPQERVQNYIQYAPKFPISKLYDIFLNSEQNGCIIIEE